MNSVQVVVKDKLGHLAFQGFRVPQDCLGFQNQEVRACQGSQGLLGSQVKRGCLDFLVLLGLEVTKDWASLVSQV